MIVERITRVHNPRPSAKKRKARRSAAKKRHNPLPQVLTLGVINPAKGGHSMAKTRKRRRSAAKKTTTHRKRRNPSYSMRAKTRRSHHRRRKNPFSTGGAAGKAKQVVGMLLGMTLTRITSSLLSSVAPGLTASPVAKAAATAVAAFIVGKAVGSVDRSFGEDAALGGYVQAGSDALNVFMPGNPLSLKGMGVWMPSRFAVPENTIVRGMLASAPPAPASGMGFAGRRAF